MPQKLKAQRLNGLFPLSYMGVVPVSPPNFFIDHRAPTQNDFKNFNIGDFWLNSGTSVPPVPPTANDLYMLVSKYQNVATWIQFAGGVSVTETLSGNAGANPVFPDGANNINVFGDTLTGISVVGDGVNTLTVTTTGELATDYVTDNGTANPLASVINIITNQAANNSGATLQFSGAGNTVQLNTTNQITGNTFIATNAGNLTATGTDNLALGVSALANLTSGINNFSASFRANNALTTGSDNITIGVDAARFIQTSSENISIGVRAAEFMADPAVFNINIGTEAGTAMVGSSNINIGYQAGQGLNGSANINIGNVSGAQSGSSTNCVCIGEESGQALNSATNSVALGYRSLMSTIGGSNNCAIGAQSLRDNVNGTDNLSAGTDSGLLNDGSFNTLLGTSVASNMTAGVNNTIIGANSGAAYTTNESDNIIISNIGVVGDNASIRIGTFATHTTNFQAGIAGVSIAVGNREFVAIDNTNGQLGSENFSALSWTPGISFGGGTTGITYSVQEGTYQTLGNIVFFNGGFILTSKGTDTGAAKITGLPFNSAGTFLVQKAYMDTIQVNYGAGRTVCTGTAQPGTTTYNIFTTGSGVANNILQDTDFANNSEVSISGFYFRA